MLQQHHQRLIIFMISMWMMPLSAATNTSTVETTDETSSIIIRKFHDYCILMRINAYDALRLTPDSTVLTSCSSENKQYAGLILTLLQTKDMQEFQKGALDRLAVYPNDPELRPWHDRQYAEQLLSHARLVRARNALNTRSGRRK